MTTKKAPAQRDDLEGDRPILRILKAERELVREVQGVPALATLASSAELEHLDALLGGDLTRVANHVDLVLAVLRDRRARASGPRGKVQ